MHKVFHKACNRGQLKVIEMLLEMGDYINIGWKNRSALHSACNSLLHNQAVVKLLLERGADVNGNFERVKYHWGIYSSLPIELAAYIEQTETVRVLLEHGEKSQVIF